jgi:hypothetical protein
VNREEDCTKCIKDVHFRSYEIKPPGAVVVVAVNEVRFTSAYVCAPLFLKRGVFLLRVMLSKNSEGVRMIPIPCRGVPYRSF